MDYIVPEASMQRIRQSYATFEQLTAVIAEAMGIDVAAPYQIDMQGGRFVVPDAPAPANGIVPVEDLTVVASE